MQLALTGLASGPDITLVCSTALAASVARHQFTKGRLNSGALSWERQEIYSLDAWFATVWRQMRFSGLDVPALLSPAQESLLWRSIIEEREPELFDADATARLARYAAGVIATWRIPLQDDSWTNHQDGQQFLLWWKEFDSRCKDAGWITHRDLWRLLPEWQERGFWKTGATILIGFDTVFPALGRLKAALPQGRILGSAERKPVKPKLVPSWSCKSLQEELELAARWARAEVEARPGSSVAVFVPELATQRAVVQRVFNDVFYPAAALDFLPRPAADSAFHLHAAAPLMDHPLAASAFLLLELAKHEFEQRSASAILRCAFIAGSGEERSARALADIRLKNERALNLDLRNLQWIARDCPILKDRLHTLAVLVSKSRPRQALVSWAQFIGDLLKTMGWPGDAELSGDEQDAIEAWKDAISELGTLGAVTGPVEFEKALELLRRILLRERGAAPGSLASPVQIVDSRDARGLRFDAAIATGLGEETWPPAIRVSPLIPLRLQVQAGVPGAGAAGFQQESRKLTDSLFAAAPVMCATFEKSVAPVVGPFLAVQMPIAIGWSGASPLDAFARAELGVIADTDARPFHIIESPAAGGTGILKSQSHCPFQAFAKYRLGARGMREASFGYDALHRGTFVHRALERIWSRLGSQKRLRETDPDDLRQLVGECVAESIQAGINEGMFSAQSRLAEQERVTGLLLDWLNQVERQRREPFEVEQVETEMEFDAAGLPITIRIDRIDRLPDGRVLLLDYKTGRASAKDLECPRPREPQLLVYAAAASSEVAGVYFAKVKARELKLTGFGPNEKGRLKWDPIKAGEARDEIERLATDFLQGRAAVHPRNGACSYCEIKPFCRVNEQAGGEPVEDCE